MLRKIMVGAAALMLLLQAAHAVEFNMVTASERGTYFRFCVDMTKMVAAPAKIPLGCLSSAGSVENVKKLRYDPGVKMALVQSDVFQAFMDQSATDREAANLIKPLRVILPLYDEEIYFLVRADSPMHFVQDIKGKKMSVGSIGSGTALTANTLYRLMFNEPLPTGTEFMSNEDGMLHLLGDKSVDVVVVTGGQPMPLLANVKPEAKQLMRLLKVDANDASTKAAQAVYNLTTVRKISYPNLLDQDVTALAEKTLLVTYDFGYGNAKQRPSTELLVKFTQALCNSMGYLQDQGHSKWRDVQIGLPELGKGWSYYQPTAQVIRQCMADNAQVQAIQANPAAAPASSCSAQAQVLGLCK